MFDLIKKLRYPQNTVACAAALFVLTACDPILYTSYSTLIEDTSQEQIDELRRLPTFKEASAFDATLCEYLRNQKRIGLSPGTSRFLRQELASRKAFNSRDLEILTDPSSNLGTGMSLNGLKCSYGSDIRIVSRSFYGRTHNWQVQLSEDYLYTKNFAYLEGNGQEAGMRVVSWN
jgi:hypothetical protein